MAKQRSQRRRSQSKARTMRLKGSGLSMRLKGGALAGNPASAWGWGLGTLGGGWNQFMNSLTLQPGQNLGTVQSNAIVPVGNINAQDAQGNIGANMSGNIPGQAGGKRRRHRRSRGGNFGAVLSQAAVPGILLAAQQTYGKTRKHRK
jgi:hypothetical protein